MGGKILIWKITRTHLKVHMCLLSSPLHFYVMLCLIEQSHQLILKHYISTASGNFHKIQSIFKFIDNETLKTRTIFERGSETTEWGFVHVCWGFVPKIVNSGITKPKQPYTYKRCFVENSRACDDGENLQQKHVF